MVVKVNKEEIKWMCETVAAYQAYFKLWNMIFGSETKVLMIDALARYKKLTKMEIHKYLIAAGQKIAYKNTSANLDSLKKEELVSYKKEGRYNQTSVSINKKNFLTHKKKMESIFARAILLDNRIDISKL